MSQQISFQLSLNSKLFEIPTKFKNLADVPIDIYNTLIFSPNHQYDIKSNVSENILESFINYWINGEAPEINIENLIDYISLSDEFNIMQNFLNEKKKEFDANCDFLKVIQHCDDSKASFYETQISTNIDNYLEKKGEELIKLPIHILMNIFKNTNCNLSKHDLAYSLIIKEFEESKNKEIFSLISIIDGMKLTKEHLNDSIMNREQHEGFLPRFSNNKETEKNIICLHKTAKEQQEIIDSLCKEYEERKSRINQKKKEIMNRIDQNQQKIKKIEEKHNVGISTLRKMRQEQFGAIRERLRSQINQLNTYKSQHSKEIDQMKKQIDQQNRRPENTLSRNRLNVNMPEITLSGNGLNANMPEITLSRNGISANIPENMRGQYLTEAIRHIQNMGVQIIKADCIFRKTDHPKRTPAGKPVDILFNSTENGRLRGIIRYISDECGGNVHEKGAVEITSSSIMPKLPLIPFQPIIEDHNLIPLRAAELDNHFSFFGSNFEVNSWICYDFVDAKVKINAYSIRSYMNGKNHLKSWKIEGSNDKIKWTKLDERTNDMSLNYNGKTNTFLINNCQEYYRYIRLLQTGPGTYGVDCICISALEYFGTLIE